jgi:hypothetical protein
MRVQVYYNLHKRCLSVRHRGKVIKHAKSVILRDASFRVQPAGRERVLKQKRKNVHDETWSHSNYCAQSLFGLLLFAIYVFVIYSFTIYY